MVQTFEISREAFVALPALNFDHFGGEGAWLVLQLFTEPDALGEVLVLRACKSWQAAMLEALRRQWHDFLTCARLVRDYGGDYCPAHVEVWHVTADSEAAHA